MSVQTTPERITIGEKCSVQSAILGEERPYWVYLPPSYNSTVYAPQRHPVLYLLDGEVHFHCVTGIVDFMSGLYGMQIPELIIVAIPNTNRNRDLTPSHATIAPDGRTYAQFESTGGGDAFLQFMRHELFPTIESTYRTMPYRILVGHSLGGLLALHALMDAHEMLQAYIAIDPSFAWDDQMLVREAESWVKSARDVRASVYISLANNSPTIHYTAAMEAERVEAGHAFATLLESASLPGIRSTLRYFADEDHGSVPLQSLYHGLRYVFDGYKPPITEFVDDTASLSQRFECISARLGVPLLPPEAIVNAIGLSGLHAHADFADSAAALLKLNVTNYPESYNAYDSLGEAYAVKNEKALAIECYEKSLELNPGNENAKKRLQMLTGEQE